jgi:hypothetical protein
MFKSSIVFLFMATLLSAAQSSLPAQTQSPNPVPVPAPAQQQPKQPYSTVVPNSGVTPDSEKNAAPQHPPFRKIKVAVPPKPKPERFPTGILDKETPA